MPDYNSQKEIAVKYLHISQHSYKSKDSWSTYGNTEHRQIQKLVCEKPLRFKRSKKTNKQKILHTCKSNTLSIKI